LPNWFLANTITFILAIFLNFVIRRSDLNVKKRIFGVFWRFLGLFWPYLCQKLTQKHIFGGFSVMKSVYVLCVNISINLESFEKKFQLHKLKNLKKFVTFLGARKNYNRQKSVKDIWKFLKNKIFFETISSQQKNDTSLSPLQPEKFWF